MPEPDRCPVSLVRRASGLLLVLHPGLTAEVILPAVIRRLAPQRPDALRYWVDLWGHQEVPLAEFASDPWAYANHQRGIVTTDNSVLPGPIRLN